MASFLTLVSRYFSKKKDYREKQAVKIEKEKKQKATKFAKEKPDHAKRLKAWEKAYGEKKQDADAKFNEKRKKRIMRARAMGPDARKKTYRSASIYMAKDPFTKKPSERAAKVKGSAGLTKRGRKREQEIRKYFAPQQIKENFEGNRPMPAIRGIPQGLIDTVIKTQQDNQVQATEKPLDLSLKVADTKSQVNENIVSVKQSQEELDESAIGWFRSKKRAIGKALSGSVPAQKDKIMHGLNRQAEKNNLKPDSVYKNLRADDLKTRANYVKDAGTGKDKSSYFDSLNYKPMSGRSSLNSSIKGTTRSVKKFGDSIDRLAKSMDMDKVPSASSWVSAKTATKTKKKMDDIARAGHRAAQARYNKRKKLKEDHLEEGAKRHAALGQIRAATVDAANEKFFHGSAAERNSTYYKAKRADALLNVSDPDSSQHEYRGKKFWLKTAKKYGDRQRNWAKRIKEDHLEEGNRFKAFKAAAKDAIHDSPVIGISAAFGPVANHIWGNPMSHKAAALMTGGMAAAAIAKHAYGKYKSEKRYLDWKDKKNADEAAAPKSASASQNAQVPVNKSKGKGAASAATPATIKKKVNENKDDSDAKFSNDMVKHHTMMARVEHAKGNFKKRDEHLSHAADYKNFGTSGLAGFDPREEVVMEGAKKMKLKPGMSAKEFKAAKKAFVAKKSAPKKVKPKVEAPAPKPADEDEGMLGKLLKGKLPAGDFHAGTVRGAITSIAKPNERLDFQKKLWKAKSADEVTALLKSRK